MEDEKNKNQYIQLIQSYSKAIISADFSNLVIQANPFVRIAEIRISNRSTSQHSD